MYADVVCPCSGHCVRNPAVRPHTCGVNADHKLLQSELVLSYTSINNLSTSVAVCTCTPTSTATVTCTPTSTAACTCTPTLSVACTYTLPLAVACRMYFTTKCSMYSCSCT